MCGHPIYDHQFSRLKLCNLVDELFNLDNFITDVVLNNVSLVYSRCIYNHRFSRLHLCGCSIHHHELSRLELCDLVDKLFGHVKHKHKLRLFSS